MITSHLHLLHHHLLLCLDTYCTAKHVKNMFEMAPSSNVSQLYDSATQTTSIRRKHCVSRDFDRPWMHNWDLIKDPELEYVFSTKNACVRFCLLLFWYCCLYSIKRALFCAVQIIMFQILLFIIRVVFSINVAINYFDWLCLASLLFLLRFLHY